MARGSHISKIFEQSKVVCYVDAHLQNRCSPPTPLIPTTLPAGQLKNMPAYRASASIACAAAFSRTFSSQAFVVTSSEGSLAPPHPPWLHARTLYLNPRPGIRRGMLTGWEKIVGYHAGKTGTHDEFPRRSPLSSSLYDPGGSPGKGGSSHARRTDVRVTSMGWGVRGRGGGLGEAQTVVCAIEEMLRPEITGSCYVMVVGKGVVVVVSVVDLRKASIGWVEGGRLGLWCVPKLL